MSEIKATYLDHMGDDLSVINEAYVSFNRKVDKFEPEKHAGLLDFLVRGIRSSEFNALVEELCETNDKQLVIKKLNGYKQQATHWSPFSHQVVKFHCVAPIAIHAQCVKHQVGFSMNTVSRRYVKTKPELFVPVFHHAPEKDIKQGRGAVVEVISDEEGVDYNQQELQDLYYEACNDAISLYEMMISMGVAPEQARFVLPQGVFTEFVWTGTLFAWARFCHQRNNSHAQAEIRELAVQISNEMSKLFPHAWSALMHHDAEIPNLEEN